VIFKNKCKVLKKRLKYTLYYILTHNYIVKMNNITKNNAFFFIAFSSFFPIEVWHLARSTFFGIKYFIFIYKQRKSKKNYNSNMNLTLLYK